jgi:hypothetical protein
MRRWTTSRHRPRKEKPFVHPDQDQRRLWSGISCYATEAQARRNARRYRSHGSSIAAIEIEDDAPLRVERTLGQDFDEGEDGDDSTLPEVMYGAELAARATGSVGSRSVEIPG